MWGGHAGLPGRVLAPPDSGEARADDVVSWDAVFKRSWRSEAGRGQTAEVGWEPLLKRHGLCCHHLNLEPRDDIPFERPKTDVWLPVWVEWLLCVVIWSSVAFWAFSPATLFPETNRFLPPALMWMAGYPLFFGFVSSIPSVYICVEYVVNFVCLGAFAYLGALRPFLCGAVCGPVFLFPVMLAAEKGLVKYDTSSYSIGVGWTTGISNGIMFLVEQRGLISTHSRFVIQSLGWTLIMSGIPIAMLIAGIEMTSYKLTLPQTIRYSAFQLTVYTFIYYGVCANLESLE